MKIKNSRNAFFFIFLFNSILITFHCDGLIEDWEVTQLTNDFARWHTKTFPGEATFFGELEYGYEIFNPDLENIKKINDQLNRFYWRLFLVDTSSISFKNRVNYNILKSKVNYLLFEFQEWKRWQHDSYFYTQKLYDAFTTISPQFPDTSENISAKIYDQIRDIPGFLNNTRKNLKHINNKNIDVALEQIEFIKNELPFQYAKNAVSDTVILDSLNSYSERALDSLESFQQFLADEKNRTPGSLLHFNKEMYQSFIVTLLNNDLQIDSLIKIVERDYQHTVEKMAAVAQDFFNEQNKSFENVSKKRLCQLIIDEINKDIPRKDQIISLCTERDNYHKLFVDEVVDFPLPADYSIKIDWASTTGTHPKKLIELLPVKLFGDSCFLHLNIKPVPDDIEWIAQLSLLRDFNRTHLKASMLLDGFPIHYYFWFQKKQELALLAKVFPEQPFLAGFTYNFASTLVASGLGGYDRLLEFVILEHFARICFYTFAELKYFSQQYSNQQVDSLFIASKIFNLNQSGMLLKNINCYPGQNLLAYWGIRQFRKLEKKYSDFQRKKFRKKEFYGFVLKQGPIPLILLDEKLFKHFKK